MKQEAKQINIVWCDDQEGLVRKHVEDLLPCYNCKILAWFKQTDELEKFLKDNIVLCDAVVVDFNIDINNPNPQRDTARGFQHVHNILDNYKDIIPFYLYSAREIEFIKAKYKSYDYDEENDYFFKSISNSNKHNRIFLSLSSTESLLSTIVEEVTFKNTPEFKIRQEFAEAFEALQGFEIDVSDIRILVDILLYDNPDRSNLKEFDVQHSINSLRMIIDLIHGKFKSKGLIPEDCSLNKFPEFLESKYSGEYPDDLHIVSKSLVYAFGFFLKYAQDASHDNDSLELGFKKYLLNSSDIYIVKALVIIELDIVRKLWDFYNTVEPTFEPFKPFIAKVSKIVSVTVASKMKDVEGAIVVDDEEKKYFIKQPDKEKYRYKEGNMVRILGRKKTEPKFGDFYVDRKFVENLDVKND